MTPTPASAFTITEGEVTTNCSYGSCSYYLSREATRKLDDMMDFQGGAAASGTLVCVVLAVPPASPAAVPCGVLVAAFAAGSEVVKPVIDNAVHDHPPKGACFKLTRTHVSPAVYPSTNNGKYCKD